MLDLRRSIYIFDYCFRYLFNFTFFTRAAFCKFLLYLQFGVMDDVNSLINQCVALHFDSSRLATFII